MGFTLLCGILGYAVFLILHVLIWRTKPSSSPRIFLLGILMAIGMIVSVGMYIFQMGDRFEPVVTIILFHALMAMFTINFYGSLVRSVSITLLLEIYKADSLPVPFDRLLKDYEASSRFEDRVVVMKNMGWVTIKGSEVQLTDKGTQVAGLVHGLAKILSGRLEG